MYSLICKSYKNYEKCMGNLVCDNLIINTTWIPTKISRFLSYLISNVSFKLVNNLRSFVSFFMCFFFLFLIPRNNYVFNSVLRLQTNILHYLRRIKTKITKLQMTATIATGIPIDKPVNTGSIY